APRRFAQRTLPVRRLTATTFAGPADAMPAPPAPLATKYTLAPPVVGADAASAPMRLRQRTRPVSELSASARPSFFSTKRRPPASTGWNSISLPPLNDQTFAYGG